MKKLLPLTAMLLFWALTVAASSLTNVPESMTLYALRAPAQPEKGIELYPNPVTEGRLTITATEDILSVQVMNITGKIVFNEEYPSNTTIVTLELEKLEKGIYLVRINFPAKEVHTEKIMIK